MAEVELAPSGTVAPEGLAGDVVPVVILNWNGTDDTIACLRSVRASEYAGFVPVVVDNGSARESVEALKEACSSLFREVCFLRSEDLTHGSPSRERMAAVASSLREGSAIFVEVGQNLGFAGGSNLGIRLAELLGSDAVMLLNNDTVVEPGAFRAMRAFIDTHPEFGAATAQIRHFHDPKRIQNCGGDLTFYGGRRYRLADEPVERLPGSAFSRVTFATGCALYLRHSVLGPLSERFFFGEEDYELALRAKAMGVPMACVHGAVVLHKGGATLERESKPLGAILVHYANRLIDLRRYYSSARWHVTRMLTYLYLPFALRRAGIELRKWPSLVRELGTFVATHDEVGRADFLRLARRS